MNPDHKFPLRFLAVLLISFGFVLQSLRAEQSPEWPAPTSAEDAARLAALYVTHYKIDVSRHRILPARYVETGPWTDSLIGKGPYWQIAYELPRQLGGQFFVLVYRSGKIGCIGGR